MYADHSRFLFYEKISLTKAKQGSLFFVFSRGRVIDLLPLFFPSGKWGGGGGGTGEGGGVALVPYH